MAVELATPIGLLGLAAIALAAVVWRLNPPPLPRWTSRLSLGLRCLLLLALVGALSGAAVQAPASNQTLIVVADRSASMEAALSSEGAQVLALRSSLHGGDRFGVVAFGASAVVDEPPVPVERSVFTDFATQPNPNGTDAEVALRLAASLMPGDTERHIVMLSDGRLTTGDAFTEVRVLRQSGIRVDVLPVQVSSGPEVLVAAVRAPSSVAAGAGIHVRATIDSNVATTGRVRVLLDNTVISDVARAFPNGETEVDADLLPQAPGFHDVRVTADPGADTLAQNNSADALVQVLGTQRVLVVEGSGGEGANLGAALRAAALEATVVAPSQMPVLAGDLGAYQAVALVDVAADQLGGQRMQALHDAVENLGVGLSVFGGTNTLGPGGFAGTPLEAALPVDMRVSDPQKKAPVAVVLVLESVENAAGDAVVRGSARALVEKLTARDLIGVTDAITGLAVPLQPVTDRGKVEGAINAISNFGDPPSYEPFLSDAEHALLQHPNALKHIILLGDGDTGQPVSSALIADMVAHGITVSSVGVDIDGNQRFMAAMRQVADQGHGRYYQSESANQVPDILLKESQSTLKPWIVTQRIAPAQGAMSAPLAGIDVSALPAVEGYVATTAKASAEVALYGLDRDPLLAGWQFGLGRADVWTSDASGGWTAELLGSPQGGRLIANVVASTLPLTTDPSIQVSGTPQNGNARLVLDAPSAPNGAVVSADVVGPGGSTATADLVATQPGRFEGDVPAPGTGPYVLRAVVSVAGRTVAATTSGFTVPYSPEFRVIGTDRGTLAAVARDGGGALLAAAGDAARQPLPPAAVVHPLAALLLAAAVVLLVGDVAVRRLAFSSGDAAVWREQVRRTRDESPVAVEATLGRLRARVGETRAARESTAAAERASDVADQEGAQQDDRELATRLLERRRGKSG
ncbi:MAG: VWA domain-containing protein [Candidatus Dormibacteraeota bacterium]|uniref:VWA domain-containing protein n=1 Tax=Candidatus Amunia macphersoniae TaxID=3127014 RepID=A0A934KH16_9BACT|nr:VWA domain-containing protein [Candidatus Dormibacteraeota bacterium]